MAPRFIFVPGCWFDPDSGLNAADRLTLTALCRFANRDTGECWPSLPLIASQAKLSLRTVKSSIARLEAVGAVAVRRGGSKRGDVSHYTVLGYDPPKGANQHPFNKKGANGAKKGANETARRVQISTPNVVKENEFMNDGFSSHEQDCNCIPRQGYAPDTGALFWEHEQYCNLKQPRTA